LPAFDVCRESEPAASIALSVSRVKARRLGVSLLREFVLP